MQNDNLLTEKNSLEQKIENLPSTVELINKKGGAQPIQSEEDFEQKRLQITVNDIEQSMIDLNKTVLNFDAKTFIHEMIDEKTQPLLKTCQYYLQTIVDLQKKFDQHHRDYNENRIQNQKQLSERVQIFDYRQKWEQFEKKNKLENDNVWKHILDSEREISNLSQYKKKSEETQQLFESELKLFNKKVNDTVEYIEKKSQKLENYVCKFSDDLRLKNEHTMNKIELIQMNLDTHQSLLDNHKNAISKFSQGYESLKIFTESNFKKQLFDYNRKITSLRSQQELNTLKMGEKLIDELYVLVKRFRHKLLYQIGLTDDPLYNKNDHLMDDVYSQDLDDKEDILKIKRSASQDKLEKRIDSKFDVNATQYIKLERVSSAQGNLIQKNKSLIKNQKKYASKYDRNLITDDASEQNTKGKIQIQFMQENTDFKKTQQYQKDLQNIKNPVVQQKVSEPKSPIKQGILKRTQTVFINTPQIPQSGTLRAQPQSGLLRGKKDDPVALELKHRLFLLERQKYIEDSFAFLRAARKITFRTKALQLVDHSRREFIHELDHQDRFIQERKGKDQLNALKVNPHRIQMFSINEIWSCVQQRLIELNVMKNPDEESSGSDSDSSDYDNDFDFVQMGKKKIGELLKKKPAGSTSKSSLADMMKKNDFLIIQKMLEKAIQHELDIIKCGESIEKNSEKIDDVKNIINNEVQENIKQLKIETNQQLEQTDAKIKKNNDQFVNFKDETFPKFMEKSKQEMVVELLQRVNQFEGEIVTKDFLVQSLEIERLTNVQEQIDKESKFIKQQIQVEIFKQTENLDNTIKMIQEVENVVQNHEQKLLNEEKEGALNAEMTEEQRAELGIIIKNGMKYDKDGNLIGMTKKDLQIKLLEANIKQGETEELIAGLTDTINTQQEQIKAFNKKLANSKADTEIIMNQKKSEISHQIDSVKYDLRELEEIVTRGSIVAMVRNADKTNINSQNNISAVDHMVDSSQKTLNSSIQTGDKALGNWKTKRENNNDELQEQSILSFDEPKLKSNFHNQDSYRQYPNGKDQKKNFQTINNFENEYIDETFDDRKKEYNDTNFKNKQNLKKQPSVSVSLTIKKQAESPGIQPTYKKNGALRNFVNNIDHLNSQENQNVQSNTNNNQIENLNFLPKVKGRIRQSQIIETSFQKDLHLNKSLFSQNIDNSILKSFNNFAQSNRYGSQDLTAQIKYDQMQKTDFQSINLNKTIHIHSEYKQKNEDLNQIRNKSQLDSNRYINKKYLQNSVLGKFSIQKNEKPKSTLDDIQVPVSTQQTKKDYLNAKNTSRNKKALLSNINMQLSINKISHHNEDIFDNKQSNRTASSIDQQEKRIYLTSIERKTQQLIKKQSQVSTHNNYVSKHLTQSNLENELMSNEIVVNMMQKNKQQMFNNSQLFRDQQIQSINSIQGQSKSLLIIEGEMPPINQRIDSNRLLLINQISQKRQTTENFNEYKANQSNVKKNKVQLNQISKKLQEDQSVNTIQQDNSNPYFNQNLTSPTEIKSNIEEKVKRKQVFLQNKN